MAGNTTGADRLVRCAWVGEDPLMIRYHDEEWGVPVREGRRLLAKLLLDGAQAGLSWRTILHKREGYYQHFDGFDPARMARYDEARIEALMQEPAIVRNRQKIRSAIGNARAYLVLEAEGTDFAHFLWSFTDGVTRYNRWERADQLPAQSTESVAMSRALKKRGFSFVGPTICYAFMQATGMVHDHLTTCFRHEPGVASS